MKKVSTAVSKQGRNLSQPTLTIGLDLTTRFWLTLILLPITIALVVALIADLDTPSRGLIRLDQRVLQQLKADMNVETTK